MSPVDAPVPAAPTGRDKMRLVLCFDGTWNKPEDNTNVSRMYSAIPDMHSGCEKQLKFYDSGVGTEAGNAVRGGTTGRGLDLNILQGYCWLIEQYEPGPTETVEQYNAVEAGAPALVKESFRNGDEIFLFGFSRGAFTARSLGGLLNACGIPRRQLFKPDKSGRAPIRTNSDLVQRAWEFYRSGKGRHGAEVTRFRKDNCWDVKIKFMGVWDTVGALGIPLAGSRLSAFFRNKYKFHDTKLCRVVENAFHALAIDEHRKDFDVALWTDMNAAWKQVVEQRWFPGAHSNVGGGYEDDLLPDPSLYWMASRARDCGLEFSKELMPGNPEDVRCSKEVPKDFELHGNEYLSGVRDSYKEMGYGIYSLLSSRNFRRMLVNGVNEKVDATAYLKWANDNHYRPSNLALAGRSDAYE